MMRMEMMSINMKSTVVQENKLKKGACEKESDTVFVDIASQKQ